MKVDKYKMVDGQIVDTDTNEPIPDVLKELNSLWESREHHRKERAKKERVLNDMVDVIDGFIALEGLRHDGWI